MTKAKQYAIRKKTASAFGWGLIALFIGCLIAMLVSLVMLGIEKGNPTVLGWLCAGSVGGIAVFGGASFLVLRHATVLGDREADALELQDGENSFFVGEGILATFENERLRIHGEGRTAILVPYREMRFFSVCSRRAPKEKGEWNVVMELPARYLNRRGKAGGDDKPVLIMTGGKERLYTCLERLKLTLLGEAPHSAKGAEPFERRKRFFLYDREKRGKSRWIALIGAAMFFGGVGLAFWNTLVGAVVGVFGLYAAIRASISFFKARSEFSLYREGIYYREPSGTDDVFLKWEEIVSVRRSEGEKGDTIRVKCLYGDYEFPLFAGAAEEIAEMFPEKREDFE